jgi:hypothetical protein
MTWVQGSVESWSPLTAMRDERQNTPEQEMGSSWAWVVCDA